MRIQEAASFSAVLAALALMPFPIVAQRAGIVGRVLDDVTGSPISGATVAIVGTATTESNAAGYFSLLGLPAGDLQIQAAAPGYAQTQESISLAAGQVLEVELRLTTRPIELGEIVVEGAASEISPWLVSNGFAARRADGQGLLHFTQHDLRFQSGSNLADVLRHVPGIRIRRHSSGGSQLLLDPSPNPDGSPCRVGIYLNGSAVELGEFRWTGIRHTQRAVRPLRFDDLLRLEEVDGMELYGPGESPVASESDCGALMLWSSDLRNNLDEPLVGSIEGDVHDADGVPLVGAEIVLQPLDLKAVTDERGRFSFPELTPGPYRLSLRAADLPSWESDVLVKAFAATKIDIRMSRSSNMVRTNGN